jgi:hypothetical protein
MKELTEDNGVQGKCFSVEGTVGSGMVKSVDLNYRKKKVEAILRIPGYPRAFFYLGRYLSRSPKDDWSILQQVSARLLSFSLDSSIPVICLLQGRK